MELEVVENYSVNMYMVLTVLIEAKWARKQKLSVVKLRAKQDIVSLAFELAPRKSWRSHHIPGAVLWSWEGLLIVWIYPCIDEERWRGK